VARWSAARTFPNLLHEGVASRNTIGFRARVAGIAPSVDDAAVSQFHFARRDALKSDLWTLSAPNRTIAVPDASWSARERLACGNDVGKHKQE
jgi:hypothetical protein